MRHIFVINPNAGKKDSTEEIVKCIDTLSKYDKYKDIEFEVYTTKSRGDAVEFVKKACEESNNEPIRFYACGGDGTINEVVNGMAEFSNASFACYPCGSGNDFVKIFKGKDFTNIQNIIDGEEIKIDLVKTNDRYCVNITNIGFDAAVAYNMVKFKRIPLVNGKFAYRLGLIKSLFREMKHWAEIYVDDEKIDLTGFLLACACNGICCGGSYYCSPKSIVNDGYMDVIAIKHISVFKFLKLVKYYQNGTYQEREDVMKHVSIHKAKKLRIVATKKPIIYGLDGESFVSKEINVELIENKVTFISPRK